MKVFSGFTTISEKKDRITLIEFSMHYVTCVFLSKTFNHVFHRMLMTSESALSYLQLHSSLDRMEEIANLEDLSFVFAPRGEEKGAMTKFVFQSEQASGEVRFCKMMFQFLYLHLAELNWMRIFDH